MNLLPDRGILAVAAVVDVALNGRVAPVPAKALADRLGLAPRHLEPLLQDLVRAGILKGTRGPRGGYGLARERRRVTAADILRIALPPGEGGGRSASPVVAVVAQALDGAGEACLRELAGLSVDELCLRAEGVGAAPAAGVDFAI